MQHRQKKETSGQQKKLKNKRNKKRNNNIHFKKKHNKKKRFHVFLPFFWKITTSKKKNSPRAFHPDFSCWVLLHHVDAIDLLLLQVAPQYRWSGSSRHGASQQCQTTGTCQVGDHIFLGQQTNPQHPVISSQVRCLDGMFLGFSHTEPQFRWPWMSRKDQIEPIFWLKKIKIFWANFPIIPKPELFGGLRGDPLFTFHHHLRGNSLGWGRSKNLLNGEVKIINTHDIWGIDTNNGHFWKETHFLNHHFWCLFLKFRGDW